MPIVRQFVSLVALGFVVVGTTGTARADTWQATKGYTNVIFSWDNLGLSRQSAKFGDVEGTLDFTPTEPEQAKVDVRIRTASVQSGSREFDDLLRRAEFFNTPVYPFITFRSSKVEPTGEKEGIVAGDLTINGITKPVALAVTWNFTGAHPLAAVNPSYQGMWVAGFSARATVERSAFGMTRGLPLVSDQIEITIEAEFVRKGE